MVKITARTQKLKQYNSTWKRLLLINEEPVCIVAGNAQASKCLQYLNGYNVEIHDGKIKKILDEYMKKHTV